MNEGNHTKEMWLQRSFKSEVEEKCIKVKTIKCYFPQQKAADWKNWDEIDFPCFSVGDDRFYKHKKCLILINYWRSTYNNVVVNHFTFLLPFERVIKKNQLSINEEEPSVHTPRALGMCRWLLTLSSINHFTPKHRLKTLFINVILWSRAKCPNIYLRIDKRNWVPSW